MKLLRILAAPLALVAASPQSWESTSYQDFVKGRFTGIALSKEGRMRLAPKLDILSGDAEPAVWSIARAADGTVYFGTGHKGKLYRLPPGGKPEIVFTAPEAEIFAVAADSAGRVYAATSPNGKIYRIEGGESSEYFAPGANYIWSLAIANDGALYAGTGSEGKIYRIAAANKGEVWYDTGQAHVTALLLDRQGRLLAGTEPNGILYRVAAKDKAFVLYDANLPEIRALALGPGDSIYAAAMGGSVAKATTPAAGSAPAVSSTISVTATSTSITVTDQSAQPQADQPKPAAPAAQPAQGTAAPTAAPVVEVAGVEKSAVYLIHGDNTVDTLFSSKEENVYDIAVTDSGLLLATDNQGRIYSLDRARKTAMLVETRDNEAVRLASAPGGVLVAAANPGKLYRLANDPVQSGSYESGVHDATTAARWGKLSWRAQSCNGCRVSFRTRSGNSAVPDKTWSEWSEPLTDAAGSPLASPNARFVQWKAEMSGSGGRSPELDWVRLAYLPQNLAPSMKSVTVSAATASAGSKPAAATAATPTYSITVTDTGEAGASSATGTATQPLTRASSEQIVISWLAEDLDGDKLIYSVWVRGEGESDWKPVKRDVSETLATLDAEALADGRYWFRVTVSDRLANPQPHAREDEMTSAPILVDRTPPAVTLTQPARSGAAVEIKLRAKDAGSPLKAAEYSIDAGPWAPLAAEDGVVDSEEESFVLRIDPAPAGEHVVVVRATDSANNAGLAKLVLKQ